MGKIRVLIIDDSAVARQFIRKSLEKDPKIDVVGVAPEPDAALSAIEKHRPDVLTLDVEMPKTNGITFLRRLMRTNPIPTIMVSAVTLKGADITFQALEIGGVGYVTKPSGQSTVESMRFERDIREMVKVAAGVKKKTIKTIEQRAPQEKRSVDAVIKKLSSQKSTDSSDKIIAIGASTGGTEAIKQLLLTLPPDAPAIVIAQHIPSTFSQPFAKRMNACSQMTVSEAKPGEQVKQGHVYIAPGDKHLLVSPKGSKYVIELSDGPEVNHHRPSVDVLFRSVAQSVGKNAIGIILTGMGDDGAIGLKEIKESGAPTIAQDEESSIVWGMPGAAVQMKAAKFVLPLGRISSKMMAL